MEEENFDLFFERKEFLSHPKESLIVVVIMLLLLHLFNGNNNNMGDMCLLYTNRMVSYVRINISKCLFCVRQIKEFLLQMIRYGSEIIGSIINIFAKLI